MSTKKMWETPMAKAYLCLFTAISDALEEIESQNYGDAKNRLISAQRQAEEYIMENK